MDRKARLFVTAYSFLKDGFTCFLLPGKEVRVEGANEVLLALLRQCNGYQTAEEIMTKVSLETGCSGENLWEIIEELTAYQILIEDTQQYLLFHEASANPRLFSSELPSEEIVRLLRKGEESLIRFASSRKTSFENLLEKRKSVREFSGGLLSPEEIQRLAWATYGKTKGSDGLSGSSGGFGTIPSGGALYSLRLFVLIRQSSSEWMVCISGPKGLQEKDRVSMQQVTDAFLRDSFLEDAAAILVLACDFQQTTQKYGNRGYRFALLEAGHAAQNTYLWCTEQNLGVVEIGGFLDRELSNLLSLSYPQQAPLTTLVVGRRNHRESTA